MSTDSPEVPMARAGDSVRAIAIPRAVRGYDRQAVDQVVANIAEMLDGFEDDILQRERDAETQRAEFQRVVDQGVRERDELLEVIAQLTAERDERIDYTEQLERELASHRELESSLRSMVMTAERIGDDLRALTERQATALLDEARSEARRVLRETSLERDQMLAEMRRIRAMLHAAQEALDERALFAPWAPEIVEAPTRDHEHRS